MHEAVGQLTIVGENQQTFRIRIQAPNVEESLARHDAVSHKIADARSPKLIFHRGVHPTRLVQRKVLVFLIHVHAHTINANDVHVRVHAHALLADDFAVDLNAAFVDHQLAVTARSNARLRQDFLQAHAFCLSTFLRPAPAAVSVVCAAEFHCLALRGNWVFAVIPPVIGERMRFFGCFFCCCTPLTQADVLVLGGFCVGEQELSVLAPILLIVMARVRALIR